MGLLTDHVKITYCEELDEICGTILSYDVKIVIRDFNGKIRKGVTSYFAVSLLSLLQKDRDMKMACTVGIIRKLGYNKNQKCWKKTSSIKIWETFQGIKEEEQGIKQKMFFCKGEDGKLIGGDAN